MPATNRFIPPNHERRTLVLAFDGTGDQFDDDNSNVEQFFAMLKKNHEQQLVYYQAGIGTYTIPKVANPLASKVNKIWDSMVGSSVNAHIMGGYEFLMQNYRARDKICIFGFSRGAYTARALAGMLHKVGLLPTCNHQQVPFAYKMYTRDDDLGWKQSAAFKRAFSLDVTIEFLGVWDTVESVGVIASKRLPFTASDNHIRYFRHAVSLDERRARFKPNLWFPSKQTKPAGSQTPESPSPTAEASGHDHNKNKPHKNSLKHLERTYSEIDAGQKLDGDIHYDEDTDLFETDVEEVWFSGCHCDVGGGSVTNDTPNALARIPLRWMVRQCFLTQTGIMFDKTMMSEIGIDWNTLYPEVKPRPPMISAGEAKSRPISGVSDNTHVDGSGDFINEEEEDVKDALSPIYDQLSLVPFWWLLEFLPLKQRKHVEDKIIHIFGPNLGQGRDIPHQKKRGVKVHRSVKIRMEAADKGLLVDTNGQKSHYNPRAKWSIEPQWVD